MRLLRENLLVFVLLAALLLSVLILGLHSYSAALGSDPFGIVHFAGHLARGRFGSDFPVYSWFKPDWEGGETHFVLGGNYLASSRGLYCKYTIGFPLILAAFIRIFGPDSVYYANFLMLAALLGAVFLFARQALGRCERPGLAALLAPFLLVVLIGKLWSLSLRPARDVSALALVVGGCFLLLRGAGSSPRPKWGLLGGGAFCLGLAASIRLPNVLAAFPAGLYLVFSLRGRSWGRAAGILLLAGACFVLGTLPALHQNRAATGNPLKPPRPEIVERNPLKIEGEATPPPLWLGFFQTTAPETLRYFWRTYGPFLLFLVLMGLRRPRKLGAALWFCLGVPAVFVIFYSFWVHLMIRYMMIAHPFLLVLAAAGVSRLFSRPPRLFLFGAPCLLALDWWVRGRMRSAYGLEGMDVYVLIFGIAVWLACVWRSRTPSLRSRFAFVLLVLGISFFFRYLPGARGASSRFQLEEARRFGRDLNSLCPPGSVIFSTKPVSQFITLFSGSYGMRPFEMDRLGVDTRRGIERIMARGHEVFLLETGGWKRDAARALPSLRRFFDLEPAGVLRGGDYNLEGRFGRPASTLWRLRSWRAGEVARELPVPGGGPWILALDARSFAGSARVELDGRLLAERLEEGMNFFSVPAGTLPGPRVFLRVSSPVPLPADLNPLLVERSRPWRPPVAAQPDFPAVFAEDGFSEARLRDGDWVRTWWSRPGRIALPTSLGEGGELAVRLRLAPALGGPRPGGAGLRVSFNGHTVADLDLSGLDGWRDYLVCLPGKYVEGDRGVLELLPYAPPGSPPSAGEERIGAFLVSDLVLEHLLHSFPVFWPASAPSFLAVRLEDFAGQGSVAFPLLFFLDGQVVGRSERPGTQRFLLPRGPGREVVLEAFPRVATHPVPLAAEPLLLPASSRMKVDLGRDDDWAWVGEGFYERERFCDRVPVRWTSERATLFLPLFPSLCRDAQLLVRGLDLAPSGAGARKLRVFWDGDLLGTVELVAGESEYHFPLQPASGLPRLVRVVLEVDPWVPAECLSSRDTRRLGLMIDSVSLECLEPSP